MPEPLERTLREEVQATAQSCARLLDLTRGLPAEVVASIRATAEETSRSGVEDHVTVAVVGDSPAVRRALVNAALGVALLGGASRRDDRVTVVRPAAERDYEARSRDMRRVVRFSVRTPDRRGLFEKHIAQAEEALAQARDAREQAAELVRTARAAAVPVEAAAERARRELEEADKALERAQRARDDAREELEKLEAVARRESTLPAVHTQRPPWWAFWLWLWRLVLSLVLRDRIRRASERRADEVRVAGLLASRGADVAMLDTSRRARDEEHRAAQARVVDQRDALATLERQHEDTRALDEATARLERLRRERDAYVAERDAEFAADLRALDEAAAAGEDVAELVIDFPGAHLRDGLSLVDLPGPGREEARAVAESTAQRGADAFVLVHEVDRPPSPQAVDFADALALTMPRLPAPPRRGDGAFDGAFFDRVADRRTLLAAARAAMRMRGCVSELARARAAAELLHGKRLRALEGQRIPDPTAFRAAQLERMQSAIDRAAEEIVASGVAAARAAVGELRAAWLARVTSPSSRAEIEAAMRAIDAEGAAPIAAALERTTERVAGEMQAHAESLLTWALEEIHARYQVARRFGAGELGPAASELTREDLERDLLAGPVSGAMDAFEKERVGLGLGGAAAGAVIGTLIAPGIGTAIGAFLGVFAGFLEGVDGLKRECASAIDGRLRPVEEHAVAQLEARRHEIAGALRASVDEAVAEALERLDQAIGRLMDVERRAIEGARAAIGELRDAQGRLDEHDARLAELVADASKQLAACTAG